jgi:hypothetical protein
LIDEGEKQELLQSFAMNNELRIIWAYVRAVFGHWWFIIIEVSFGACGFNRACMGTWLLPPRWVRVAIGVAVLVCGALHNEMAVATVDAAWADLADDLSLDSAVRNIL